MPSPALLRSAAPAPATTTTQTFHLEVVCRTQSADTEPCNTQPNDPVPAPALGKRRKGSKARVHPSPGDLPLREQYGSQQSVGIKAVYHPKEDFSTAPEVRQLSERKSSSVSVFDVLNGQHRKPRARWKQRLGAFLDGIPFTIISIIFTIMILYADLIRVAVAPAGLDPYFFAWTIFAISFFLTEIILSSLARPGYFLKFYFWMDVLASFSLLCEVPGFVDVITFDGDDSNRHVTVDRAAKLAQAGARAARIMQVIAVVQLLRYKARRLALSGGKNRFTEEERSMHSGYSAGGDGSAAGSPPLTISKPQTRLGEKVTEMTMRKVILGVIILLLVLPVFDAYVYYGFPTILEDGGLVMLHEMYLTQGNTSAFEVAVQSYVGENTYRLGTQRTGFLFRLVIANQTWLWEDPSLRREEQQTSMVLSTECAIGAWESCWESKAWVNVRWGVQMQALLDIGRITFILAMLSVGALLFIRDTDILVLQPIERMIENVKSVSENPLAAHSTGMALKKRSASNSKQLETRILEHSISKICSMLSVGFGEAGAEVIADNIRSGGDLNPMIPGRKVRAIFGFCDIRNFTDATEVLQEEVMEFVNSIANIVHTEVSLHGGSANKNIGDAFLLVWKLPGSVELLRQKSARDSILGAKISASKGLDEDTVIITHLADAALASFAVIQAALQRSRKLQEYSAREDLNARLSSFSVKLGFGLHVGWAIEGAIGSRYKIDASYLSPHVNIASRLEAATKQFGVSMLLSDAFVSLLSPSVRRRVRQIDCVTLKGSHQPIGLYTLDVDSENVSAAAANTLTSGDLAGSCSSNSTASREQQGSRRRSRRQRSSKGHRTSTQQQQPPSPGSWINQEMTANGKKVDHVTFSDYPYFDEFEEHPDIVATRAVDDAFLELFGLGFEAYRAGDWGHAATIFEQTRTYRRNVAGKVVIDGPSEALLGILREKGEVAPADWQGYRELTEK